MGHFSNAALAQIEAQAARLKYEANKEFYDKLAAATARAKEKADAAKRDAELLERQAYLEQEIARMREELYSTNIKFVKVGSSDPATVKAIKARKGRPRVIVKKMYNVKIVYYVIIKGREHIIPEEWVDTYPDKVYSRKVY